MKKVHPGWIVVAIVTWLSPALLGNGFRLVSQDAFAAARGEAFVATADNASAIHYNPAGLTQLAGHQLRTGIYALHFDPTFRAPAGSPNAGRTYHIDESVAVAPQLFYSYRPEGSPVTLGVGVYSPHGAAVEWPQDTGFRAVATEGELTYIRINPVLAVEVAPGVSVGGGMMIDYADLALEQGLLRTERPFDNRFRFEGDDLAVGFNFGVLWEVNEQVSVGATLRTGSTLDFDGETKIEQQPIIQPTTLPATAEFDFPLTAVVGLSYRPTPEWNFEVDVDYTDWSSIDTVTIRQEGRPPFPVQQDVPVVLQFEDSWMLKFGVTRYLGEGWRASAGYVYNENSVPDDFYSPTVADLDRHILSFGIGRECPDYTVDVTYQFGFASSRTVSGSLPASQPGRFVGQNADGTYDFESHALLVSFGKRF